MIPNCKKNSYITAVTTVAQTVSANTGGLIPLDSIINDSNDKAFSLKDSEIICNFDGIIIVNTSINFTYGSGNNYIYIYKNEDRITNCYGSTTLVTSNFAMPVKKGDKISARYHTTINNKIGTAINQTFLNIVRIK